MNKKHRTTLEQWRILQAVVDAGSYARAASRLNRSVSSLNSAVAKLQQQLGIELLAVRGRKAELTPAGEVLLRRSRQLTEDAWQLEVLAENLASGWEPELKIAVEPLLPRCLLNKALRLFWPESRGTRLQIRETVLTATAEAITEGLVDIAICGLPPKGYLGENLGVVRLIPVCHADHPLTRTEPLSSDQLRQELQIVIRDSARNPQEHHSWLRAEQRWTVDSFEAAIDLLRTGIGFCWLPEHSVCALIRSGELSALRLREGQERVIPLNLIVPRPDQLGPSGQKLLEALQTIRLPPLSPFGAGTSEPV